MTLLSTSDKNISRNRIVPERCQRPIAQHVATSLRETLNLLDSEQNGLSNDQILDRQHKFGQNEAIQKRSASAIKLLLQAIHNPFIYVLLGLMLASVVLDYVIPLSRGEETDLTGMIIMGLMIILSTSVRFIQEFRTNKITESLDALIKTECQVIRKDKQGNSFLKTIARQQLVPGDIVRISTGDIVPADLRLLTSTALLINQSVLTGESTPIEKAARQNRADQLTDLTESQLLTQSSICLMGTCVTGGGACGVVVATGNRTWFGSLAQTLSDTPVKTAFDHGVNKVSWLLIRFMLCMVPLVFVFNGLSKGDWLNSLFFALAVAVGLTPEMLPMIVTTNLAKGARTMAAKKVVVRRLSSIQNLGAMDVLCTDKTGTLTEDQTMMQHALDFSDNECPYISRLAWLNSAMQTGFNSPMDQAIIAYAKKKGQEDLKSQYRKIAELPFDFTRRCLSVAVSHQGNSLLITKGAPQEMLARCSHVNWQEEIQPLTPSLREQIRRRIADSHRQGSRILLIAQRNLSEDDQVQPDHLDPELENNLILQGMLLFSDPIKDCAKDALFALKDHGIQVKVLTGDSAEIADKVCRDLGFSAEQPLLGSQIERMDDDTLKAYLLKQNVFARLTPHDKYRIVTLLQQQGHVTGFLGDGVNDAAALQAADIGISVDNATDVARHAADMILLEKNLHVVVEGVRQGRHIFANIIKYLNITASSNFGNVFSVMVASLFIPFIPMLAIQLLILNLIYDISQMALPWDNVDEEQIRKPGQWDASGIGKVMLIIGPVSSLFDIMTFAVMWHVFSANSEATQTLFHTGWFVESLLSQTLIVHLLRTAKIPFIQSIAAWPLTISTLLVVITGITLPFTSFANDLGLQPLPFSYFIWLLAILGGYCVLSQKVKNFYCKRYGRWF